MCVIHSSLCIDLHEIAVRVGHVAQDELEADQAQKQDGAQSSLSLDRTAFRLEFGEFLLELRDLFIRALAQSVQRLLRLFFLIRGGLCLGLSLGLGLGLGGLGWGLFGLRLRALDGCRRWFLG